MKIEIPCLKNTFFYSLKEGGPNIPSNSIESTFCTVEKKNKMSINLICSHSKNMLWVLYTLHLKNPKRKGILEKITRRFASESNRIQIRLPGFIFFGGKGFPSDIYVWGEQDGQIIYQDYNSGNQHSGHTNIHPLARTAHKDIFFISCFPIYVYMYVLYTIHDISIYTNM